MKYSRGFRNGILKKVLPPENRSVNSVAKGAGISPQTIQNWLLKLKDGSLDVDHGIHEPRPSKRPIVEKLRLLLDSKALNPETMGEWLRTHGLHNEHLSLWEQELEEVVTDKQNDLRSENTELKKENKRLQKEVKRNQAAMAEALALLTLKKKAEKLFSSDAED